MAAALLLSIAIMVGWLIVRYDLWEPADDAGLPTAIIRDLLPCLNAPRQIHLDAINTEMHGRLVRERDRMTQRIACLTKNRDAIDTYLAALNPPVPCP